MTNKEHLKTLRRGADHWKEWRTSNLTSDQTWTTSASKTSISVT